MMTQQTQQMMTLRKELKRVTEEAAGFEANAALYLKERNEANAIIATGGAYINKLLEQKAAMVAALELTVSRFEWLAKEKSEDGNLREWITVSLAEARAVLALAKGN